METGSEGHLLKGGARMGLAPGSGESEAEAVNIYKETSKFHQRRGHVRTIGTAAVGKGSKRQTRIQKSLTLFHFYSNSFYKVVRVIRYHGLFVFVSVFSGCKNENIPRIPCKNEYKNVLQTVKIKQFFGHCLIFTLHETHETKRKILAMPNFKMPLEGFRMAILNTNS